jgi:hypothetical protein
MHKSDSGLWLSMLLISFKDDQSFQFFLIS